MLSLPAEFCAKPQNLKGQVEGDGHSLRKIYVSNGKNQEVWLPQLQDARQRWKKQHGNKTLPKYWLGHVRVAGHRLAGAWQLSEAGVLRGSEPLRALQARGFGSWCSHTAALRRKQNLAEDGAGLEEAERAKLPRQPQQARVRQEGEEGLEARSHRHAMCRQVLAVGGEVHPR